MFDQWNIPSRWQNNAFISCSWDLNLTVLVVDTFQEAGNSHNNPNIQYFWLNLSLEVKNQAYFPFIWQMF